MKITEDQMRQKIRMTAASTALWELISEFNVEGDYLTSAEWLLVLHDAAAQFIRRKIRFARAGRKSHETRVSNE